MKAANKSADTGTQLDAAASPRRLGSGRFQRQKFKLVDEKGGNGIIFIP